MHVLYIAANAAIKYLTGFVFVWQRALNSAAVQKAFTPTAQFDRCDAALLLKLVRNERLIYVCLIDVYL
jgi:hypothetical protein